MNRLMNVCLRTFKDFADFEIEKKCSYRLSLFRLLKIIDYNLFSQTLIVYKTTQLISIYTQVIFYYCV